MSKVKQQLALVVFFVLTRVLFINYFGVQFEYEWVAKMWHFIDVEMLKNDLLNSLYYFHYQPPLFNLFLGFVLKQSVLNPEVLLRIIFWIISLVIALLIHHISFRKTNNSFFSILMSMLFLVLPETVLYENWPIYTWTSALVLLMGYFVLDRFVEYKKQKDLFFFFLLMSILVLTRSAFHPVYYFFFMITLYFISKINFTSYLKIITIPTCLILCVAVKNKIEFGFFGVGSGLGFSMYKISPKKDLDKKLDSDNEETLKIMRVVPVKSVSTYLSKNEISYEVKPDTNLLKNEFKSTRSKYTDEFSVNLGNIHYLDLAKRYQKAAFYLIKNYPKEYLSNVLKATIMFFKPTWDHGFGIEYNKVKLKTLIDFVTLESIRHSIENYIYKFPKPWPLREGVAFSSYLIIPFFYFLFFLFHIKDLIRKKEFVVDPSVFFSLCTVIYLILVSNLVELAENNRYRAMVDPLVFTMIGTKIICYFRERLNRS